MTICHGIMNILPHGPYFNIWLPLGEEQNDNVKKIINFALIYVHSTLTQNWSTLYLHFVIMSINTALTQIGRVVFSQYTSKHWHSDT